MCEEKTREYKIYNDFIEKAIEMCQFQLFIKEMNK